MTLELIKYQMFSGHVYGFEMFAVLLQEKRLVQTAMMKQDTKYLSKQIRQLCRLYQANGNLPRHIDKAPLRRSHLCVRCDIWQRSWYDASTISLHRLTALAEWKETVIADSILQLTARLSTRIFLGDTMCRNEAWLSASKAYTVSQFPFSRKVLYSKRQNRPGITIRLT